MTERYDVALDLLDIQLLDAHGVCCGRIDDLELDGDVVSALLVGRDAWRARLPRPLRRLVRGDAARIPWSEVLAVSTNVRLKRAAREYALNGAEVRLGAWLARIPGL